MNAHMHIHVQASRHMLVQFGAEATASRHTEKQMSKKRHWRLIDGSEGLHAGFFAVLNHLVTKYQKSSVPAIYYGFIDCLAEFAYMHVCTS